MIVIHIVAKGEKQAVEIVDFLVENKLILNAVMIEKAVVRSKNQEGELESITQTLIMGKTKALLFNTIDQDLREKYPSDMPVLYSVPIVNMDWEQADELVKETAKV